MNIRAVHYKVVTRKNQFCMITVLVIGMLIFSLITTLQSTNALANDNSPANKQSTPITSTQVPIDKPTPISGAVATPSVTPTPIPLSIETLFQNNLDKILVAVITAILTLIVVYFQKIISALIAVVGWIWKRLKLERAIEARYRTNLARELRSIQILQMTEAKNLDTIFIPLKLDEWIPPEMRVTEHPHAKNSISFSDAINQFERITIVGGPGSGKTTITSHAAAAIADRNIRIKNKDYLPIYIHLRRLREFLESQLYNNKSLKDFLSEILGSNGFIDASNFLDRKISEGICLIILDGFDELADKDGILQQRLSQKVVAFVSTLPSGNRVVLTSRAAGVNPHGFRVFECSK